AHVVQHDLRQPCAEPPRAGDQQAENAVLAQRRLKILRIAENRRDAGWHFALKLSGLGLDTLSRLRGSGALSLSDFRRDMSPTGDMLAISGGAGPASGSCIPLAARPARITGAPSFRAPRPKPAAARCRGLGLAAPGHAGVPWQSRR